MPTSQYFLLLLEIAKDDDVHVAEESRKAFAIKGKEDQQQGQEKRKLYLKKQVKTIKIKT